MNEDAGAIRDATGRVPAAGTPGRLRTRVRDKLIVRIAQRRDDELLLAPMTLSDHELAELEDDPVQLECGSPRGLICLRGHAELLRSGMIEFRLLDDPELVQRRRHVRIPAPQPVTVIRAGERVVAESVNLSGGGMLLTGPASLELGDRVMFRIELRDDEPPVEGWAQVVRTGRRGERAIEFVEIERSHRERLIHFVFARQRQTLRVAREEL